MANGTILVVSFYKVYSRMSAYIELKEKKDANLCWKYEL